jgi:hypothetical protein
MAGELALRGGSHSWNVVVQSTHAAHNVLCHHLHWGWTFSSEVSSNQILELHSLSKRQSAAYTEEIGWNTCLWRSVCLNTRSSRQWRVQANGTRTCGVPFAGTRVPLVNVAFKQMEHVLVTSDLLEHGNAEGNAMNSERKKGNWHLRFPFVWTHVPLGNGVFKQMEHVLLEFHMLEHAFLSSMSHSSKWNTFLWRLICLNTAMPRGTRWIPKEINVTDIYDFTGGSV